ncbi:MAG TPA: hypothetical protein VFL63_12435, partial [Rhodanobacteraceae bacterium]|nr:hypothetical protein [Rhodanobacteraceae bacterium]
VAEALAHGCPAIVSHGAPWSGLETERCGWWIPAGPDTLARTLDAALRLPEDRLATMGNNGREWMRRDFSWQVIGQMMDAAYRWLLAGGNTPRFIKSD